jgi:hypothetical protein
MPGAAAKPSIADLLPLEAAAAALGIGVSTLSLYVTQDAPVAVRGRRGRGGAALFDIDAVRAWIDQRKNAAPRSQVALTGGTRTETLQQLAIDVERIVGAVAWRRYRATPRDEQRRAAETLAAAGFETVLLLRERIEADAGELTPLNVGAVARLQQLRKIGRF